MMPNSVDSWRVFIAIELPGELRHKITKHVNSLRAALPEVRASWVREENLHLTLKFIGDCHVERIEPLSTALLSAANLTTPFEIEIGGCGSFPSRGKPNVLWIGITDRSRRLQQLHAAIEDACAQIGFARDARSFSPHLTIARLRQAHGARELTPLHQQTQFEPYTARISSVCLMRSELSSQGSRYTVIARHEFIAATA